MDPYLHVMMHKYQHLERMKRAEHERLLQSITQPSVPFVRLTELSRRFSEWRRQRRQIREQSRHIAGKVVLP